MILYEFEGKKLLQQAGIIIPESELATSSDFDTKLTPPVVLKAQVLSGKRADVGGIVMVDSVAEIQSQLAELFNKTINGEPVQSVLIEQKADIDTEYYLSLTYDTDTRGPVLSFSQSGGTGIEERGVQKVLINPLNPLEGTQDLPLPSELLNNLISLFFDQDCILLEINPLIQTKAGEWVALDAKIKLDDSAQGRHEDWNFPPRSAPGHTPTKREIEAKKIDENDYRGVAGSAFFDLPGDIAVMASGGGASLVALDALTKVGGKAANYTEYGGNPPKEKVFKLTQIVLDKPNLHGLWVVGALANFTNIYETLSGFVEGLREAQKQLGHEIDFPIVIRRAGPHDDEARQMLSEVKDFDIHLYGEETSITESAKIMRDLAQQYAEKHLT